MAEEYSLSASDYVAILRRRWRQALTVFVVGLLVTAIITVVVPPVYESSGTILIESQQIPDAMVQGAVSSPVQERIELIKQRVMTRETLLQIISKYNLYKDDRNHLTPTELVDEIRNAIVIDLVSAGAGKKGNTATIAFRLTFQYTHAYAAYKVANELCTLFLNENAKSRTERAAEATEFLSKESQRLKADLEKIELQVASYKKEHADALPEHQELRVNELNRTETGLSETSRDLSAAKQELSLLEIELDAAKANVGRSGESGVQAGVSELDRLKQEYAKLLATYTENHPNVRAVKRRIEALEKGDAASSPAISASQATSAPTRESLGQDLLVAKVQAKINMANDRITALTQQKSALQARMNRLQSEITVSPSVEMGLTTLLRDYDNAKKKYEETQAKQMSAQLSENLEQDNKGEKFSLVEPPQLADKPVKPDRIKMLLVGLMLSFGSAVGFTFLAETINQRIFGVDAVATMMQSHPLVVIPYITLHDENVRKRKRLILAAVSLLALLIVVLILVHVFYMPLNVLLFKIAARFG